MPGILMADQRPVRHEGWKEYLGSAILMAEPVRTG
jgi:hypothetical protein